MKRMIVALIVAFLATVGCTSAKAEEIDFEAQGFKKISTTAYCMGTTTASGTPVRTGICAVDREHMGMTALVYTLDGQFLGFYECLDTGGSEGIKSGHVIDIYRPTYTQCVWYMKITNGKCWVKYIDAEG